MLAFSHLKIVKKCNVLGLTACPWPQRAYNLIGKQGKEIEAHHRTSASSSQRHALRGF